MENSFKPGYEKSIQADGAVELSFTSQSVKGDKNNRGLAFILLFPALVLGWLLMEMLPLKKSGGGTLIMIWLVLAGAVWLVSLVGINRFVRRTEKIVVVPHVGVKFSGKTLPFSDIQSIGVIQQASEQDDPMSYVYLASHGNSIKVSGYLPASLAIAVRDEIAGISGVNWKV